MAVVGSDLATFVADRLRSRNDISHAFFTEQASPLAHACGQMAARFTRGGRLFAFGRGAYATDAQHVSVEFVHPVIVGKRALPAADLSASFEHAVLALAGDSDIVMGFAPPSGDRAIAAVLDRARRRGAFVLALPGREGDFQIDAPDLDPFVAQELIEVLYHTLWETVHVFFEHDDRGREDVGASGFLYPFLGRATHDAARLTADVAASIRSKAGEVERLRRQVVDHETSAITDAITEVAARIDAGRTIFMFGNGGSATDANDWAIDCVDEQSTGRPIRAHSLSAEPATLTALANDIGRNAIFLRQLVAHGRPGDVAIAISTSGGSTNVIEALEYARQRGLLTVALLGYDGGEIVRRGLADLPIVVRCDYIPRIQEVQASIYHVMTEAWRR